MILHAKPYKQHRYYTSITRLAISIANSKFAGQLDLNKEIRWLGKKNPAPSKNFAFLNILKINILILYTLPECAVSCSYKKLWKILNQVDRYMQSTSNRYCQCPENQLWRLFKRSSVRPSYDSSMRSILNH